MAHNISTNNATGKHEIFVAGEPAWHQLGVNVGQTVKWEEAMKLANLGWNVSKRQLSIEHGTAVEKLPHYGLFRDDMPGAKGYLSHCGSTYQPIQNKKAFDFVDVLLNAEKGAHYVSAGALGRGEQIWCLAKMPESSRIKGTDDISHNYLLFTNWHIAGRAAITKAVNERVVCENTMQIALGEVGPYLRLRHDGTIDAKMEHAKKLWGVAKDQIKSIDQLMNIFAKTKLSTAAIGDVITALFPDIKESVADQEKAREILKVFEWNDGDKFKSQRGTAYNLLNGVTGYVDHLAAVRPRDGETEAQARARVAMFGKGEALKFMAIHALMAAITKHQLAQVSATEYFFLK
jgi:phage/plasmid-like protein (TIGR03299 family)